MRTACYLRFSSDAQRDASIRDQLRNVEAYCARAGWPSPAVYQDQAISGARNDRPGYQAMLAAAEAGMIDALLVDDLSRLSRDHIESAQAIRRLKFAGVRARFTGTWWRAWSRSRTWPRRARHCGRSSGMCAWCRKTAH